MWIWGLLLHGCAEPSGPVLPSAVRLTGVVERPTGDRWLASFGHDMYDTPFGLLVDGGPFATLVRTDGRVERHFLKANVRGVDSEGRLDLMDPHGDWIYDLRTGRSAHELQPEEEPDGVAQFVRSNTRDGVTAWMGADGEIVVRDVSGIRRATVDLPGPGMDVRALTVGGDQRLYVAVGHTDWDMPDAPQLIVAVALDTLQTEATPRLATRSGPTRRERLESVAWTPHGLLAVVARRVGWVADGRWTLIQELGSISTLHTDPGGTVWAAGTRVWRLGATGWEVVLDALPSAGEPAPFTYDARTGAMTRVVTTEAASLPNVPEQLSAALYAPRAEGRGVPALDTAVLADGERRCGQPAHPVAFVATFGDCDRWTGLTGLGAVLRGGPTEAESLTAPVGEARALDVHGERVYVGGTEAIAVWDGSAWARWPVSEPVAMIAVWGQGGDEVVWWGSATDRVCRLDVARDDAPVCRDADVRYGIRALAPSRDAVIVVTGGDELRLARVDGPPQELPGRNWEAVLADPARGFVWGVRTHPSEVVALKPGTGEELKSWPVAGYLWAWRQLGHDGAGGLRIGKTFEGRFLTFAVEP